jgi:hypothetical protein
VHTVVALTVSRVRDARGVTRLAKHRTKELYPANYYIMCLVNAFLEW